MLHDHNLKEHLLEESKANKKIMPEDFSKVPQHQHQREIFKDG
jgi:hypothetical protein